jgi:hypothetical protein
MKTYEISLEPHHVWDMLCKAMSIHDIPNTLDQKLIERAFCSADLSKMELYAWDITINMRVILPDLISEISEITDLVVYNPYNVNGLMGDLLFSLLKMGLLKDARLDAFLIDYNKHKHEIFSNSTPISLQIIPKMSSSLVGKIYKSHVGDTITFSDKVRIFPNNVIRILNQDSIYTMEFKPNRLNLTLSNENVVLKTWVG